MIQEFKWCVRPELSMDNAPKIYERDFGDGYTQRQVAGINNLLRTFSVVVKVRRSEAIEVDKFLAQHKGVEPFYFIDPISKEKKKVVCTQWPAKAGITYTEFTCAFKEVADTKVSQSSSGECAISDVPDLVAILDKKLEQFNG